MKNIGTDLYKPGDKVFGLVYGSAVSLKEIR